MNKKEAMEGEQELSLPQAEPKKIRRKRIWIEKTRLEELEKKALATQFYLDHLQRLQAEFENYRKRSSKDKEEFRKFVLEDFILELLNVLDNFQRALEAAQNTQNSESLRSGVDMIYRQFWDTLSRKGLSEISSLNQPFDPLKHEAISYEVTAQWPPSQVISEMAKGYVLHGKVIRPSKVKVSKEPTLSEPKETLP